MLGLTSLLLWAIDHPSFEIPQFRQNNALVRQGILHVVVGIVFSV